MSRGFLPLADALEQRGRPNGRGVALRLGEEGRRAACSGLRGGRATRTRERRVWSLTESPRQTTTPVAPRPSWYAQLIMAPALKGVLQRRSRALGHPLRLDGRRIVRGLLSSVADDCVMVEGASDKLSA